jgi:hypothetical protein
MEGTVGLVSTCGRELLRGWWWLIRPYGEFYNFYSISLEDFDYHLVYILVLSDNGCKLRQKYVGVVLYTGQVQFVVICMYQLHRGCTLLRNGGTRSCLIMMSILDSTCYKNSQRPQFKHPL